MRKKTVFWALLTPIFITFLCASLFLVYIFTGINAKLYEDKLIKTIADASEVEVPASLVERQIDNNIRDMEYRMMYQGIKLEDYLKYTNQTLADYRKTFEKQAKEQVKTQLVIEEILKLEKIVATEEEIDAKISEQATQIGKDFEEYKKSIPANQLSYFENNVLIDKLFAFLTANNKID